MHGLHGGLASRNPVIVPPPSAILELRRYTGITEEARDDLMIQGMPGRMSLLSQKEFLVAIACIVLVGARHVEVHNSLPRCIFSIIMCLW